MSGKGEIILYYEGEVQMEVHLENETVWLTQAQMAQLFQTHQSGIARHLKNIFKSGELDDGETTQTIRVIDSDKPVKLYSLDAIISVGYRINSYCGTQFRKWATQIIKEHLVKSLQTAFQQQIQFLFNTLQATDAEQAQYSNAGYVYLLQSPTGCYKIGRTKHPEDRIQTFRVKLPFEVEYLHLIQTTDMIKAERCLHDMFADKRVSGEWFALNEADIEAFRTWTG